MSTSATFTILLGGPLTATPRLLAQVAGARCIAADGGMVHSRALGLEPELWVGDFDSTPAHLEADYGHVPRQTHPADKDKTDGEIAIEAALTRGAGSLVLAGGLGGETGHALGHLALLLALAGRGIRAFATSGLEEAYPLTGGTALAPRLTPGARLSIIAFSTLSGLNISGVRWPLTNSHIASGSTRTLSNVVTGDAQISLTAGSAILVASP